MPPEPTLPAAPVDPTAPPVTPGADSAPRTIDDTAGIEDPNDRSVAGMLDEVESRLDEIERNLADLLVQSMTDVPVDREDIVLSETGDSTRPGRLTPQDPSAHRINQNGTVVARPVTAAVNPARTGGFDEQGIWHDVMGRFARKGWSGAKAAMLRTLFDASADVLDGANRATPTRLRLKDEGLAERLGAVDRIIEATYADGEHAIVTDWRGRRVRVPWNEFDPDFAPVDVGEMNDLPDRPMRTVYHLTDKAKFKPDPKKVPTDNALSISPREGAGLFVAKDRADVERWVNGSGYLRPFVAEIDVPEDAITDERWANEGFIPADRLAEADVKRVIPVDAFARETYADYGWVEDTLGSRFDDGAPVPPWAPGNVPSDYRYDGPDARDMSADEVKRLRDGARVAQKARASGRNATSDPFAAPGDTNDLPDRPSESPQALANRIIVGNLASPPVMEATKARLARWRTRDLVTAHDTLDVYDRSAKVDDALAMVGLEARNRGLELGSTDDGPAAWRWNDSTDPDVDLGDPLTLDELDAIDRTLNLDGGDFNDAPDRPVTDDDLGPDDPALHGTRHINHGTRNMGSWNVTEARPVQGIPAYEGSYRLRDNSGRTVYATADEIHDTADAAKTARTAARRPRRTKAELDAAAYRAAGDMGAVALFSGVNPRTGRPLKDDPFTPPPPTTPTPTAPTPALDPFDGWDIEADLADTEQQLADLPPDDTTFRPSLEAHATFLRTKLTERNNTTPNTPNTPQTTNRDTPTTTSPTPPTYNDLPAPPRMPEMARTYSGDDIRSFTLITNGGIDSPAAAAVADGIPVIDVAWEPDGPDRVRAVRTPGVVAADGAFLSTGASESLDIPVSVGDPEWLAEGFGRTVAGHGAAVRVRRAGESDGRIVGIPEFNDMADRPLPPPNKNGLYPTVEQVDAEHVRWTTEPDPDFPEDTWSSTSIVGQFVGDGGDGNAHAFNRTRVSITGWEGRYSWEVDAANPEYDDTEQWIGDYRAKVDPFAWSDPTDAPSWYEEGWAPTLEQAQADALAAANRMPATTIFRPLDTTHHEGLMDEVLADAKRRRPRSLHQGFAERLSGQPARRTEWDTRPAAEFNDSPGFDEWRADEAARQDRVYSADGMADRARAFNVGYEAEVDAALAKGATPVIRVSALREGALGKDVRILRQAGLDTPDGFVPADQPVVYTKRAAWSTDKLRNMGAWWGRKAAGPGVTVQVKTSFDNEFTSFDPTLTEVPDEAPPLDMTGTVESLADLSARFPARLTDGDIASHPELVPLAARALGDYGPSTSDEFVADVYQRYTSDSRPLSPKQARAVLNALRPAIDRDASGGEFNDRGEAPAWPEARQYVDDLLAASAPSDFTALTDDQLQATYRRIRADRLAIYPAAADAAGAVADRTGSEADYQATVERRDRLNRLVSELDAEAARRGLRVREATDGSSVLVPADAPGPFPAPTFDIPATTTATEARSTWPGRARHRGDIYVGAGTRPVTVIFPSGTTRDPAQDPLDVPSPHGAVVVRGTIAEPHFDAETPRQALDGTGLMYARKGYQMGMKGKSTPKVLVLDEATAARWRAAYEGTVADMAAAKARKAEATAARKAARAARQDSLPDGNDVVDMPPAERLAKSADDSAWLVAKDNYLSRIGVEKGQAVRVRRIGGDPVIDVLDGGTTRTQQVKLDRFADTAPAGAPRVEMPEARGNGAVAAKAAAAATTAARVQAAGDAGAPVEVADNYLSRYGAPQGSVVTVAYHDDRNAVLNVDGRQVKAGWARFTQRIPVPDGEGGWDLTEPADPGNAEFNDLPDRPGDDPTYATMLRQIGGMTLMAISGGRRAAITNDADETIGVRLPVAAGYRVDIVLDRASDTYTVTRVFSRGGKDFPKGTLGNVYADQLADIAYAASNYMDPFGAPEVNDLPDRPDQLSLLDLAPTEVRAITNAHSTFSDAGWYATDAIGGYRSPDGAVTIVRHNGGWKATDTRTTPFVGGAVIDTTTPERVVEWADQRSAALAANPVDTTRLVNDDRLAVYAADPNIRIVPAPDMLDTRKGRYGIIAETPDRSTREVIGQFRSPADAAGAMNDLRRRVAALAQDPDAASKLDAGAAKAPTFARPATVKASAARPGDWATDIQGVTGLPADGARIASVPTMDDGSIRLELEVPTGGGTAQTRYETVSPLAAVSIYRPINDQPVDRPTYTESVSPAALAAMGPDRRAAVAEAAARVAADTAVGTDRHAEAARVVAAPPARETVDGKDTSATFIALDATGVPPAPGTAAIPEGAVRLYHYPSGSTVDYVLDTGLPAPDGDRVVWAQTRPPVGDVVPFVEFWTNPNNIAAGDAYGNGHVALAGQVPTGNIVSYSTPTIAALRTFRGSPALWTADRLRSALGRYRAGSPEAAAIRARLAELGVDLDAPAADFNDFRPFEMVRSALTRTPDAEYLISLAGTGVPNGDGRVLTADEIRALSPSELRSLDRAMSSWLARHPYGDESGTDLLNTLTIDRAAPDPVPGPVVEPETPRRRRTAYSANGGTIGFIPMSPLDAPADFPVAAAVGEPVVPGERRYFTVAEVRQAFYDAYGPDADPDEVMAQLVAEQDAAFDRPAVVAAVLTQSQHDQRVAASKAAAERRRQRSLSKATNRAAQSGRQVDMSLPGSTTQPGNSYPHRPAGAAADPTPAADPQAAGRFFSALNKAFDDGANVEDVPAAQFDELTTGLAASGYGTEYLADGHMKVTDPKSGRSFTMRRRLV